MPKVDQEHLDARRRQIVDAARERFATHGFAGTSMADIVTASGLSIGAIYRYFAGKEELVTAVCEQASDALPTSLTRDAIERFLQRVRTMAREQGHARLVAQIYAEAAVNPTLAAIVEQQLAALRAAVAALVAEGRAETGPADPAPDAQAIAEAFVGLSGAYNQQLAVRGDLDPAPYVAGLMAILAR